MWNSLVSHSNAALGGFMARCVEAAWRHPWVSAGFLVALAVLALLLWIELLKDMLREPMLREPQGRVEGQPIEINR